MGSPTLTVTATRPLFRSFLAAGFECADALERDGHRLDLTAVSGHLEHAAADYRRLAEVGICTAPKSSCAASEKKASFPTTRAVSICDSTGGPWM